ncbi:hypothetical protein SAMN03159298_00612 [Pseudomonas sp. NFACC07-1]|nr:hypothetical protein SAMN03159474_00930 [Pseudomonas sp. NFACC08-1]SEI50509.1 hypothetical protein SAMN03159298_00612 [Pseudomonas sp. NFACC07-1]
MSYRTHSLLIDIEPNAFHRKALIIFMQLDATCVKQRWNHQSTNRVSARIEAAKGCVTNTIASMCAWLASEESGYANGADFSLNGGLHMS